MKVYKVELMIIDFDGLGANEIQSVIENQKFPNRCIFPDVMDISERDIGEWSDDHPLNNTRTSASEYRKLFY